MEDEMSKRQGHKTLKSSEERAPVVMPYPDVAIAALPANVADMNVEGSRHKRVGVIVVFSVM
jgi:hypothetical protein